VKDVSEESEIEETRAKYSGSCSTRGVRIVEFEGLKGGERWVLTVVIAAEIGELFFEGGEDGCKCVYGGLMRRVGFVEGHGFRGRHVVRWIVR
jgi:hypothetical protein